MLKMQKISYMDFRHLQTSLYRLHERRILRCPTGRLWVLRAIRLLYTLRTGHLNCLNECSRGLKHLNQLLYCFSLKFYDKFANYNCFTCTNLCTALSLLKSLKTLLCLLKYSPTCFDPLGSSSGISYYLLVELLDVKMYIKWCIWIKWCYVAA
jgi:hypothetical protein